MAACCSGKITASAVSTFCNFVLETVAACTVTTGSSTFSLEHPAKPKSRPALRTREVFRRTAQRRGWPGRRLLELSVIVICLERSGNGLQIRYGDLIPHLPIVIGLAC